MRPSGMGAVCTGAFALTHGIAANPFGTEPLGNSARTVAAGRPMC